MSGPSTAAPRFERRGADSFEPGLTARALLLADLRRRQEIACNVPHAGPWLGFVALGSAAFAAAILIGFLVKKPVLDLRVKLALFLGLGVFPAIAAAASTVAGMERTTSREFCGSCHVMDAHFQNAIDPKRQSLAARHSRNPFFGEHSCYVCHADYGMYGYAMTKTGGMRHVYEYYLGGYDKMSLEQALKVIHLRKPYDNLNCRQCHTTTLRGWRSVPDHDALKAELFSNKVSCASAGCHGFAHPFDKGDKQILESQASVAAARSQASAAPATSASAAPRAP